MGRFFAKMISVGEAEIGLCGSATMIAVFECAAG